MLKEKNRFTKFRVQPAEVFAGFFEKPERQRFFFFCGLFFLPWNRRWVLFFLRPSFLEIQSLCNSITSLDLILSEHMPVDVQRGAHLRVSEDTRNRCRVNSCANQ